MSTDDTRVEAIKARAEAAHAYSIEPVQAARIFHNDIPYLLAQLAAKEETLAAVREWRERHGQECNGRSEARELDRILEGSN